MENSCKLFFRRPRKLAQTEVDVVTVKPGYAPHFLLPKKPRCRGYCWKLKPSSASNFAGEENGDGNGSAKTGRFASMAFPLTFKRKTGENDQMFGASLPPIRGRLAAQV